MIQRQNQSNGYSHPAKQEGQSATCLAKKNTYNGSLKPIVCEHTLKKQKLRVLIVDDHLMWRKTLKLSFSTLPNVEVIDMLTNGYHAVTFCQQVHPDLIVLDINMPGMDGFKTAQELLKNDPDLWIIGVTADVIANAAQLAKESGIKAIIPKDMLLDYLPPKNYYRNRSV